MPQYPTRKPPIPKRPLIEAKIPFLPDEHVILEDTSEYDMALYALMMEHLNKMHLQCFWRVAPMRKGAMISLFKGDEEERMFIDKSETFLRMIPIFINWANGDHTHLVDQWFDTNWFDIEEIHRKK